MDQSLAAGRLRWGHSWAKDLQRAQCLRIRTRCAAQPANDANRPVLSPNDCAEAPTQSSKVT
jgi:hypothetical protein